MKIYTKAGDDGTTELFGGERVSKDSARIEAYGMVDELNSVLGVARSLNRDNRLDQMLAELQNDLFILGADLASPVGKDKAQSTTIPRIGQKHIEHLEMLIDTVEAELTPLKHFVLPGGSVVASHLHLARAISRRVERCAVKLKRQEDIGKHVVVYLNRLSDLLFVLARWQNKIENVEEVKWVAR